MNEKNLFSNRKNLQFYYRRNRIKSVKIAYLFKIRDVCLRILQHPSPFFFFVTYGVSMTYVILG